LLSIDNKRRALDNICTERFWRTIKYQYIYLNTINDGLELSQDIERWIERHHNRDHQGIERNKPASIYCNTA